ncbi:MAG: cytosine methyltransferase [Lachnospiraceae bacterium]|nr:cytosine methyltransferase [Lachnospiraceae bacterium]
MGEIITVAENNSVKRYRTVMADPPWDINQRGKYSNRSAESHYELMPLERIKAMPVTDLCKDQAFLFLWIPNALLQEGLDVIKAWGFTFRSPIYWIKPRLGLGNYIRNASETCLFATRGGAKVRFHSQPNWVFAPQQEHSHKPEEQFAIIERLCDGPYLELFARRRPPLGWNCWGNEIDSDIVIPGYPVPNYSSKALKKEV